jgi:hypothetical protein
MFEVIVSRTSFIIGLSFSFEMAIKSLVIYEKSLSILAYFGALIGFDLFSKDYKALNWRAIGVVFDDVTYTMVTVYCIFEFRENLEKLVFCLVTYGFAIQVSIKNLFHL